MKFEKKYIGGKMMNKLFKKKPKKEIHSAAIKSEVNEHFGGNNNHDSYFSAQSNNQSFSVNQHTPLDSTNSDPENFPSLNQNFSSIFNVPAQNKVNEILFLFL